MMNCTIVQDNKMQREYGYARSYVQLSATRMQLLSLLIQKTCNEIVDKQEQ